MNDNPYQTPDESFGVQPTRSFWTTPLTGLGRVLAVLGIAGLLIALLIPFRRNVGPAMHRVQCRNNLKQIVLALHNYRDAHKALPPAYTVDANGKPLHSWRTLILPYLENEQLYKTIDLSKPWDDPANAAARETTVNEFACPAADVPSGHTTYMGMVASNAALLPEESRPLSEITDDHAETLVVIEVSTDKAVHWMAPQDDGVRFLLNFGTESELAHAGGTQGAFIDGTVQFLPTDISDTNRRAIISIAGGDSTPDETAASSAP